MGRIKRRREAKKLQALANIKFELPLDITLEELSNPYHFLSDSWSAFPHVKDVSDDEDMALWRYARGRKRIFSDPELRQKHLEFLRSEHLKEAQKDLQISNQNITLNQTNVDSLPSTTVNSNTTNYYPGAALFDRNRYKLYSHTDGNNYLFDTKTETIVKNNAGLSREGSVALAPTGITLYSYSKNGRGSDFNKVLQMYQNALDGYDQLSDEALQNVYLLGKQGLSRDVYLLILKSNPIDLLRLYGSDEEILSTFRDQLKNDAAYQHMHNYSDDSSEALIKRFRQDNTYTPGSIINNAAEATSHVANPMLPLAALWYTGTNSVSQILGKSNGKSFQENLGNDINHYLQTHTNEEGVSDLALILMTGPYMLEIGSLGWNALKQTPKFTFNVAKNGYLAILNGVKLIGSDLIYEGPWGATKKWVGNSTVGLVGKAAWDYTKSNASQIADLVAASKFGLAAKTFGNNFIWQPTKVAGLFVADLAPTMTRDMALYSTVIDPATEATWNTFGWDPNNAWRTGVNFALGGAAGRFADSALRGTTQKISNVLDQSAASLGDYWGVKATQGSSALRNYLTGRFLRNSNPYTFAGEVNPARNFLSDFSGSAAYDFGVGSSVGAIDNATGSDNAMYIAPLAYLLGNRAKTTIAKWGGNNSGGDTGASIISNLTSTPTTKYSGATISSPHANLLLAGNNAKLRGVANEDGSAVFGLGEIQHSVNTHGQAAPGEYYLGSTTRGSTWESPYWELVNARQAFVGKTMEPYEGTGWAARRDYGGTEYVTSALPWAEMETLAKTSRNLEGTTLWDHVMSGKTKYDIGQANDIVLGDLPNAPKINSGNHKGENSVLTKNERGNRQGSEVFTTPSGNSFRYRSDFWGTGSANDNLMENYAKILFQRLNPTRKWNSLDDTIKSQYLQLAQNLWYSIKDLPQKGKLLAKNIAVKRGKPFLDLTAKRMPTSFHLILDIRTGKKGLNISTGNSWAFHEKDGVLTMPSFNYTRAPLKIISNW